MSDSFIDSNVLVYLLDDRDLRKYRLAAEVVRRAIEDRDAAISFQVVQETLNVITRKLPATLSAADAGSFLTRVLLPLWKVMPSERLYREALDIQDRYRYSFYDALVVAAALSAGCTRLYSEDLQTGQTIGRLTIVNPFLG